MLNSPLVIGFVENGVVHVTRPKFLDDAFPCIDWLIQKIIYHNMVERRFFAPSRCKFSEIYVFGKWIIGLFQKKYLLTSI